MRPDKSIGRRSHRSHKLGQFSWKAGPVTAVSGPIFVSATRFTFTSVWLMPMVAWHGIALIRAWPTLEGALGVAAAIRVLKLTTYTVTAWESETAFRRWLGSPQHRVLMRDYRDKIKSSSAATWTVENFDPLDAWEEAKQRLRNPDALRRGE